MKPALELTSVPPWTVAPTLPDADLTGATWTVVAIGAEAGAVVDTWCAQLAAVRPEAQVRVHRVGDAAEAVAAVDADLADARVGWRLMAAGPAHECLQVRAHAVRCDVADDEMTFATTDVEQRTVLCVHCDARTSVTAPLEDTIVCSGCERNLLVYYHVSRRQGAHLGFTVDAERLVDTA
ncbi:hypothetical protein BST36_28195 [Mycolicibacterium moriokaense]|uniref:Dimethylamine monooxygenase subunit DmmA-like C-terminal domain-containing protein n=1 Tax=Mycolicibacterium moriokaense TaxID=39691 RepID=A0AAD1M406_9MYCO|nr:dimethylamine monooxygenase subunit DmmA family protein [Mycolicibacterium moriokaense]MCV7037480.1 hypothetical protein [Mycolicibacterium moriokaense]ORB14765.1 hypothetical protein BST36_28195 [Mycolicibacterium moriokaense]BBW99582.1 hypothetical protein MMOR_05190 [Mycolicibacterium moriokaense]